MPTQEIFLRLRPTNCDKVMNPCSQHQFFTHILDKHTELSRQLFAFQSHGASFSQRRWMEHPFGIAVPFYFYQNFHPSAVG